MLTVGGGGGSMPQGGHFRIEPEQLDEAIALFERERDELRQELDWAYREAFMRPMGSDTVSIQAADFFNAKADEAHNVWTEAVKRLDGIIEKLRKAKHAWENAEETNVDDLRM